MELDGKQRAMLRVGLAAAFQSYDPLRRFLRDQLNFDLNTRTDSSAGLNAAQDAAIDWAVSEGRIDDLLIECSAHGNPSLKSVATTLQGQLARSRPLFYEQLKLDPFSAVFLGTEECFIGRDQLRVALKEMESTLGTRRVLVVNSSTNLPACGKTYTYELLRLLDRLGNGNVVVRVNFKDFREGDLGSRYRDIAEKINSRMKVPADQIPRLNESQTRWFQNVIDKFEIVAREAGKKLWLVFDHVGTGEIEDKIADALANTAIYTMDEASALRVVLIGIEPARLKLEPPILRRLRSDDAALPVHAEVVAFLKQARTLSGKLNVADATIDLAAGDIMNRLAALAPADRAYEYSPLAWKGAVELGLVP